MKKRLIAKLGFIFTGLLLVLSVGAFLLTDNTKSEMNKTEDNTSLKVASGTELQLPNSCSSKLEIVFSNDPFIKPDGSNIAESMSDITGSEFYISFYLDSTAGGTYEYQFNYMVDTPTSGYTLTAIPCDYSTLRSLYRNDPTYKNTYADVAIDGDYNATVQASEDYPTGNYITSNNNTFTIAATTGTSSSNVVKKALLGKLKVSTTSSFSQMDLRCFYVKHNGTGGFATGGNTLQAATAKVEELSLSFGAGSVSDSTLTVGTIGSVNVTGTEVAGTPKTGTINFELDPANFQVNTDYTLSLSVDGGKGAVSSLVGGTGMTVNGSGFTVNLSSRNTTVSGTFTATAQDTTTTADYTVNVKIKPYTDAALTSLTLGADNTGGTPYQPKFANPNAAAANVSLTSDTINISSRQTSVVLTPTVDTTKGMTVTINGTVVTSGSQYTVSSVTDGTTITVVVKPEDPSATTTKTYTYTCKKQKDITTASSISFTNQNSTVIPPKQSPSGSPLPETGEWNYTIPYSTNGTANNTVNISIQALTGSTAVASPASVTFSGTTQDIKTVTVNITDSTSGVVTPRTLKITREAAKTDSAIATNGIKLTYTKNGGTQSINGSLSGTTYTCSTKLPFDVNAVNLQVTLSDATNAKWAYTVSGGSGSSTGSNLSSGANPVVTLESPGQNDAKTFTITATVTAEDGSTTPYTITIQRDGADTDSTLNRVSCSNLPTGAQIDGNTAPITGKITITNIDLTNKPDKLNLTATATKSTSKVTVYDSGASIIAGPTPSAASFTVSLSGLSESNPKITGKIRVEAEAFSVDNTKYTEYEWEISCKAPDPKDTDPSVKEIKTEATGITQVDKMASGSTSLTVNYDSDVTGTKITVNTNSTKAVVTIVATFDDGSASQTNSANQKNLTISSLPSGTTTVTISVKAEDGTPNPDNDFIITINKAKPKSKEKGVTSIKVGPNNTPVTVPTAGGTPSDVVIAKPTTGTTIPIVVQPKDNKAKVTIANGTPVSGTAIPTFDYPYQPGLNRVTINVQPEDPDEQAAQYDVNVWVADDQKLGSLQVQIDGVAQTMTPTWNENTSEYEVKVPYATTDVDLVYVLKAADPQNVVVSIDGVAQPVGVLSKNVATTPGTQFTFEIEIKQNTTITTGVPTPTKYKVVVKKDGADTNKDILTLTDPDPSTPISFNKDTKAYIKVLPHATSSWTFTGLTYSPKVNTTITGSNDKISTTGTWKNGNDPSEVTFGLTPGGIKKHTITVTAEDGTTKIYEFYFVCAENLGDLQGVSLLDASNNAIKDKDNNAFSFNSTAANQTKFVLDNSWLGKAMQISMTKEGQYGAAIVGTSNYQNTQFIEKHNVLSLGTSNTFKVKTVSELKYLLDNDSTIPANLKSQALAAAKASIEYTIEVEVEGLDHDATLKQFEVRVGTDTTDRLAGKFIPGSHTATYTIGDLGNSNNFSISIVADPTKSTTTIAQAAGVAATNVTVSNNNKNQTISLSTVGSGAYSFSISIKTTAQDGTTTETYTIELTRGDVDVNNDATIAKIYLQDSKGNKNYINFDPTNQTYPVTIPAGIENYTLYAETLTGSKAHVTINGVTENSHYEGIFNSAYWQASNPQTSYTYKVQGVGNNNTLGTEYTVNVTLTRPSSDPSLNKLIANGENLDVTQTPHKYTLNVPYETGDIPLYVETADPDATIRLNYQDGSTDTTHKNKADISKYKLNEGLNTINVAVTAPDGTPLTYTIIVNRAHKDPRLATLGVLGYPLLENDPTKEIEVEFDPELKEYRVNVPYIKEQAEIFATPENPTDLVTGIGVKNLLVGENTFIVAVASPSGTGRTEYKVVIRRYSADEANADAASAKILEIPQFEKDFNPLQTMYEYNVTNDITSLTPIFVPAKDGQGKSSVEYYGKQLHSGENALIAIVTAPDGITTKTYVVKVNRDKMAYEVKATEEYPNYTVEKAVEENAYKVNIGKAKSVDVDFTKFIFPATDNLEVEVISNVKENPNEIIVTITDGEETEYVKLLVESTGNPKGGMNWTDLWPLLLLLIIVIILLILILICVNKDKFGKLAKKANNKQDKKNKKDAEKNEK